MMTVPRNDQDKLRISIGACFVVTIAVASTFGVYRHNGLAGAAGALAATACVWFVLSRTAVPSLLPINARPLTFTELFTLLGLCAILYGFSFPAVSTAPRGQPHTAFPSAPPTQNGG